MKDHLIQTVSARPLDERRDRAREYLQLYLLRLLHEAGLSSRMALVGGTALRVLFGLPRFSEDLDYSALPADEGSVSAIGAALMELVQPLEVAGYVVSARAKGTGAVQSVLYRFPGLLKDVGATPDPRAVLAIKVEVDTRPPAGAVTTTTLLTHLFPAAVVHFDLPSLFAGKLHALFARPWVKGRDWYDLLWYLTEKRGTEPNADLLKNALVQTGHDPDLARDWRDSIRSKLAGTDWRKIKADVEPLLEQPRDREHFTPEILDELLGA